MVTGSGATLCVAVCGAAWRTGATGAEVATGAGAGAGTATVATVGGEVSTVGEVVATTGALTAGGEVSACPMSAIPKAPTPSTETAMVAANAIFGVRFMRRSYASARPAARAF